ncbi:uncharacterized, partial [Tachysurus ichikawai]
FSRLEQTGCSPSPLRVVSARNVADVNTLPNLSETISKLQSLCDPRFGLVPRHNPAKARALLLPVKPELALILASTLLIHVSGSKQRADVTRPPETPPETASCPSMRPGGCESRAMRRGLS